MLQELYKVEIREIKCSAEEDKSENSEKDEVCNNDIEQNQNYSDLN